ncbi:MAG: type III-A CRISPR-associated RAMP protein Csm5 [Clostridia bacterium]|nr:type III-A CRISPR-associated RAMP protein Csm5 [Clostridia bacterium]
MKLNNINMFIKDIDNEPYIPASSIKGVITNAIAFNYIKQHQDKFTKIRNDIKHLIEAKGTLKGIWNKIQLEIFKEDKEDTENKNDFRRYISVSDSIATKKTKTMILAKEDFSTNIKKRDFNAQDKYGDIKKLPIYREYLVGENTFEFELVLNYDKLKKLEINSIEDILEMLQNYTKACIEIEEKLVERARKNGIEIFRTSNKNQPNIILGGGSGYYSKTLLTAIFPDNNELKELVKRTLNIKHEHIKKDTISSPRTLKLAKYNSNYYVVGMGKISAI